MNRTILLLEKLVAAMERQSTSLERIANHVVPQPGDIVGTPYIADRLGCTTSWVSELVKTGAIPEIVHRRRHRRRQSLEILPQGHRRMDKDSLMRSPR